LLQDGHYLKKPRWPADGKLATEGGAANSIIDSKNLTQPAGFWEGGTLVVRVAKIGSYKPAMINAYDPAKHELVTDKSRTDPTVAGKDQYWIENVVTILDQPGQFAVDARTKPVKVFLWPLGDADPAKGRLETPARGTLVTWGPGACFLTFDGLEAAYGEGSAFGGDDKSSKGSHDIEVVNCIGHHVERAGFSSYGLSKMTVRRCVFARNDYGVMLAESDDCLIEENLAKDCRVDGLVVSWNSDNARLIRNASIGNWFSNHPDGFQIYRHVTNLYLEGNLLFNDGQGCMMEEAEGGKFVNNMIVCTHHTGVILGGGSKLEEQVRKFELNGNTIAFTGFRGLSSNGPDMVLRNNVLLGGDQTVTRVTSKTWTADHNLYGQPEGWKLSTADGKDVHSKIVPNPKFRSAPAVPIAFVIDQWHQDTKPLSLNTTSKFYLTLPPNKFFAVGDHVEVNFDGVVRKVTESTDQYVAFAPPIASLHEWRWETIVNWKDRTDFVWDLRLADDSPGKKMGDQGQDVGSTIDIQAYFKGDFNGDGKRDLPTLHDDVMKP